MKRFKFSLQFYLDVKNKEEKALSSELYIAMERVKTLEKEFVELELSFENSQQMLKQNMLKGISPYKLAEYNAYFESLKISIKNKRQQIKQAENDLEQVQNKIVEIKKSIKMLEILKEKKYSEYLEEQQIEEAKLLDDYISFKTMGNVE